MQISRVELYELVWKLPLSKAAPQFGISATALAGVCKKHNIPYPGSLYWTMKSLGRSAEVQQLPATSDDVPTEVVIDPAKPRRAQRHDRPGQPPLPARGTGIASTVLILPTPERSPPPKMTSDVQAKSDEAGQRTAALEVPESLRRPHAIIAGWIADHARRVADSKRNKSSWGFRIEPLSDLDHRRHRILDTIFKAAERISFKVMSGQYQEVWLESGRNRNEAVGRSITMLIPEDRQDEEPQILAHIRGGQRFDHFETVRRRKDGSLIDISLTTSPIRDSRGRIIGASKIARDITERKLADARLQESERRLLELLAAIPGAIYTTDVEGRITYFNEAAVEFAGRRPVLGSEEWCVSHKLYNPDGTALPFDQTPMAIALKEGRTVRGTEAVAERPDSTRVPFIPFPTPLRDANGRITGAINMLVDISERKQAETQQRLLLDELNHRTKNNMQVLQSLLFSASRNTRSEEARAVLDEASRRISAMAAAQRVLYGTTDASRFAADEFLSAVIETVRQTFPSDFRMICERANGVLPNDAAMPLSLILNELLTNAVKHGIKDKGRDSIRVGLTESDGCFELYVEDDGGGFDIDAVRHSSSGLRLVLGLAGQLHGRFEVTRMPSRASLLFPAPRAI